MNWLLPLAGVSILGLFFLILILIVSYLGWQFIRIEKGHIVFITRGKTLKVVWPDVGNYRMSKEEDLNGWHWLIKDEEKKGETEEKKKEREERFDDAFYYGTLRGTRWAHKLLWELLGIRFVSLLWPHERVHIFKVSRKRLLESSDVKQNSDVTSGQSLKARVVDSERKNEPVNSLLFLAPRPIYVEGVELAGDNSKINLLLLPVFQAVVPSLPVYYLEGDFFPLLDAAIQAALIDFFATWKVAVTKGDAEGKGAGEFYKDSYDHSLDSACSKPSFLNYNLWLKFPKGAGSPMERHLRRINATDDYLKKLKDAGKDELANYLEVLLPQESLAKKLPGQIGEGIIPRFGFALVSFRLVDWEPHGSTSELAKALLAKETKRHEAEGVREEAYGLRDSFESRGTGEATRYSNLIRAMTDHKVSPNVAAEVLRTQLEMEQLNKSRVSTYVRGQAGVMVPAPPPPPNP